MFNDFLIWLPYSLIFHSFVLLYQRFWLCHKDTVRACVFALARPVFDRFISFCFYSLLIVLVILYDGRVY